MLYIGVIRTQLEQIEPELVQYLQFFLFYVLVFKIVLCFWRLMYVFIFLIVAYLYLFFKRESKYFFKHNLDYPL